LSKIRPNRSPPAASSRRCAPARLIPLLLIIAGTLAYINTLPNPFVFDDVPWVFGNQRIHSLTNIGKMLTETNRPVLEISLAINYALGRENPTGYHALNILIHIASALVLYGLIRRTLLLPKFADRFQHNAHLPAFAVALLWLLHPLNTQSVTYMIQRAESLMGLCYLAVLYCFLRYATPGPPYAPTKPAMSSPVPQPPRPAPPLPPATKTPSAPKNRAIPWAFAAVALCWVGMGTKEVMATAPLVVLLFDATFIAKSWRDLLTKRPLFYAALFTAWIPMIWFLTVIAQAGQDASAGLALQDKMLSPWTYLLTQPQVIVEVYLRKAFWPNPLILDYGWVPAIPQDTPPDQVSRLFLSNVLWQGTLLTTLFIASIFGTIKRTAWGFLTLTFFLILAPTSSFMPIADLAVEHRMYLPLIPLILAVVFVGYALLRRAIPDKASLYSSAFVALFAIVFALLTIARNADYQSKISIWDSAVVARQNNPRAWFNLGSALKDVGRNDEAMQCYARTLQILPSYAPAHYSLATLLMDADDLPQAIKYLQSAIQLDPSDPASHAQLGKAYLYTNQYQQAENALNQAIDLDPSYARAHEYLGLLHVIRKDYDAAAACFRDAIKADPRLFSAHQNLAAVLLQSGQTTQAIDVIEDLIRRADELNMPPDVLRDFMDRRDRYRTQASQAPAPP
jgi:protein O-mannosyl-transferase